MAEETPKLTAAEIVKKAKSDLNTNYNYIVGGGAAEHKNGVTYVVTTFWKECDKIISSTQNGIAGDTNYGDGLVFKDFDVNDLNHPLNDFSYHALDKMYAAYLDGVVDNSMHTVPEGATKRREEAMTNFVKSVAALNMPYFESGYHLQNKLLSDKLGDLINEKPLTFAFEVETLSNFILNNEKNTQEIIGHERWTDENRKKFTQTAILYADVYDECGIKNLLIQSKDFVTDKYYSDFHVELLKAKVFNDKEYYNTSAKRYEKNIDGFVDSIVAIERAVPDKKLFAGALDHKFEGANVDKSLLSRTYLKRLSEDFKNPETTSQTGFSSMASLVGEGYLITLASSKTFGEDTSSFKTEAIHAFSTIEDKKEKIEAVKLFASKLSSSNQKNASEILKTLPEITKDLNLSVEEQATILSSIDRSKVSDKDYLEIVSATIEGGGEKDKPLTAQEKIEKIDKLEEKGVLTSSDAAILRAEQLKSGEIPITDAEMTPIEVKVNGETITMDFTAAGWYDKILNFSFKNNKSGAKEIVDVVAEYGWMNNTTNKNASSEFIKQNNIPYCYAVEYRQLYNASISNIILSFLGLAYGAKGAASGVYNLAGSVIDGIIKLSSPLMQFVTGGGGDSSNKSTTLPDPSGKTNEGESTTANGKTSWLEAAGNHITSFVKGADDFFTKAMEKVAYLDSRGPTATSNKSGLLNPYRMMYILSRTNKQFCFPMLDKSASAYKVANKMDEADGGQGSSLLGNRFFGMIANVAQTVLGLAQDINQIAPFFQSAIGNADSIKSMRQYHIERSKFFTFPTDGEDIEVSFILFNTVKKNIWKKHFNFIFGFVLRNLPFKHDLVSYYPPLFYDVIVPGVKRCPYCYVERVDVSPLGLMRNMSMSSEEIGLPNLTSGGSKINYTVNVPEAWQVKIVFKSLIATSGNQILSGFVDMPIQASTTNDSLKK